MYIMTYCVMCIRSYTRVVAGSDDDFLALLDDYLEPPHDPNPAMLRVQIVWVEDDPRLGALHMAQHGVAKAEVEQVLFEIPPIVEAKRSREYPRADAVLGSDPSRPLDLRGVRGLDRRFRPLPEADHRVRA
jgi:hypothetical protein